MANEKQQEVVEQVTEEKSEVKVEEPKKETGFKEDGTFKVDLKNPPTKKETTEEKVEVAKVDINNPPVKTENPVKEEKQEKEVKETSVLQEVTDEVEEETTDDPVEETEQLEENIEEKAPGMDLPENIEKLVEFMNETGGTVEDYVRLNADYSNVDSEALLREYYKSTKPHLSSEEVNFMLEDNFDYDEESDEPRDVKRKKLAYKEEVAQAKNHLETLKGKYYQELKLGSRLSKDQQKAIDFFNRETKKQEQFTEQTAKQQLHFNKETNKVFNEKFKGFDFEVGDKKYRYNVKDVQEAKKAQADVLDVFSKYKISSLSNIKRD